MQYAVNKQFSCRQNGCPGLYQTTRQSMSLMLEVAFDCYSDGKGIRNVLYVMDV